MKLPKRDALKDQSTRFEKKRHMNAYRKNFPSSDEDVERVPDLSDLGGAFQCTHAGNVRRRGGVR